MRRFLAIVLGLILTSSGSSSAHGQGFGSELTSCAWVRAENDGAGTGFVLDAEKKLLITCRHLVADRAKVDVIFPWFRDGKLVTDRGRYLRNRDSLRERGLLVTGKVLKTSDELDLALLELDSVPAGVRSVVFAPGQSSPGDPLRLIGNRLDLDTVWNCTTGHVRATGRLSEGYFWRGKKLAANADAIIGQLPTEEGDSGGPVFNAKGELVGMASALRRQCPLAAVAISSGEIRKFADLPREKNNRDGPQLSPVVEELMRGTVWVRPTSTDIHLAGALIEKDTVLTCGKGFRRGDSVGVAFPVREGNRWLGERSTYKDSVGLALRGCWKIGVVMALDSDRDLALIRIDSTPGFCKPIALATGLPALSDNIHAMNHPSGLEFAWVYSSGSVRQLGTVAISPFENAKRIPTMLCQIPTQAGSPGGPVVNDKGELVGILSAKESTQQVGYAIPAEEIAAFLDVGLTDRSPRTLAGLLARIESLRERLAAAAAIELAFQANGDRRDGRLADAMRNCDKALALDSGCVKARLCRAMMLEPEAVMKELDAMIEKIPVAVDKHPLDRVLNLHYGRIATQLKDWRRARGIYEQMTDVNPVDVEARQLLVGVLLELHEDEKAVAAVRDTLRGDPSRVRVLAADLLTQAAALAKKFPDAPAIPLDWLIKTSSVAEKEVIDPAAKYQLSEMLKRVATIAGNTERLAFMREKLRKIAEGP